MKEAPSPELSDSIEAAKPGWFLRNAWVWFLLAFIVLIIATVWTIRIASENAPEIVPLEHLSGDS
jgi:hypothetical protein